MVQGNGVVGAGGKTARVRAGHVQFVPRGVAHFIANNGSDTLEIVGVFTGAGSIDDAGYVPTGNVVAADLV